MKFIGLTVRAELLFLGVSVVGVFESLKHPLPVMTAVGMILAQFVDNTRELVADRSVPAAELDYPTPSRHSITPRVLVEDDQATPMGLGLPFSRCFDDRLRQRWTEHLFYGKDTSNYRQRHIYIITFFTFFPFLF